MFLVTGSLHFARIRYKTTTARRDRFNAILLCSLSFLDIGLHRSCLDRVLLTLFGKVKLVYFKSIISYNIIQTMKSSVQLSGGCIWILAKEYMTIRCYMRRGKYLNLLLFVLN